jgi:hypothetical protein
MTNRDTATYAWWNTEHDHSRCWWNWEIGRWVCPPTDTTRTAVPDQPHTRTHLQEQR